MLLAFLKALLNKAFKNTNNTFETLPDYASLFGSRVLSILTAEFAA
jgi:hypothetical protein